MILSARPRYRTCSENRQRQKSHRTGNTPPRGIPKEARHAKLPTPHSTGLPPLGGDLRVEIKLEGEEAHEAVEELIDLADPSGEMRWSFLRKSSSNRLSTCAACDLSGKMRWSFQ